jgi:hypothetical protein
LNDLEQKKKDNLSDIIRFSMVAVLNLIHIAADPNTTSSYLCLDLLHPTVLQGNQDVLPFGFLR